MGLVGSMGMTGNMMLRGYNEGRGIFANRKEPKELAEKIVDQLRYPHRASILRSAVFPAVMCRKYW